MGIKCVMVILNYRDCERAIQLARRCNEFNIINKVIIVDNNSQDGYADRLKRERDTGSIELIESKQNGGFSYGLNLGIKCALTKYNANYILCANTDTLFGEEEVTRGIQQLEAEDRTLLVSLRMQDAKGIEELSNWKLPSYFHSVLECFWMYRRIQYYLEKNRKFSKNEKYRYVEVVRGSFMLFKSELINKVGYFDEKVFMYGEENILCYKIKQIGCRVALITDKHYVHNHISSDEIQKQLDIHRMMLESLKYYFSEYAGISNTQKRILAAFCSFSLYEWKIILNIKKFLNT